MDAVQLAACCGSGRTSECFGSEVRDGRHRSRVVSSAISFSGALQKDYSTLMMHSSVSERGGRKGREASRVDESRHSLSVKCIAVPGYEGRPAAEGKTRKTAKDEELERECFPEAREQILRLTMQEALHLQGMLQRQIARTEWPAVENLSDERLVKGSGGWRSGGALKFAGDSGIGNGADYLNLDGRMQGIARGQVLLTRAVESRNWNSLVFSNGHLADVRDPSADFKTRDIVLRVPSDSISLPASLTSFLSEPSWLTASDRSGELGFANAGELAEEGVPRQRLEGSSSLRKDDGSATEMLKPQEELGLYGFPIARETLARGPWLLGLLVLQSGSSFVLEKFGGLIEEHLIITLFLTMLVGAGGNAGNQSAIKVIREFATGEASLSVSSLRRCLKEQLLVGLLLGTALSVLGFLRVFATNGDLTNATAISASLFAIVLTSVAVGTALPFALAWKGVDPANAATSVQVLMDILGVGLTCIICSLIFSLSSHHPLASFTLLQ